MSHFVGRDTCVGYGLLGVELRGGGLMGGEAESADFARGFDTMN